MTKQILSQFEIEGGIGETSISITPDMNIKLKTIENDIFNSSDIQVKVDFSKKKNITVNIGKDESSTNYHTLSDAIDAVRKSVKDVSSLVNQVSTKEMFKSALTSSYMNQASIIARKKAQTYTSLYSDNSLVIKGRGSLSSSTTTTTRTLDDLIDDTKTMNPITSIESLRRVSKIIFEAMDK